VFSGGNRTNDIAEADVVEPTFIGLGVERDRLLLERRARNTQENAEFSKALALPKPGERWLLVTSAQHMPRSVGAFRKVGFAVEPYPVDNWIEPEWSELLTLNSTFLQGVAVADAGVREWMGLLAYRLTGRTTELLPSP